MMIKMAMGISQPAGRSRTFSDHGRSFCTDRLATRPGCLGGRQNGDAYSDDLVVLYCNDDC